MISLQVYSLFLFGMGKKENQSLGNEIKASVRRFYRRLYEWVSPSPEHPLVLRILLLLVKLPLLLIVLALSPIVLIILIFVFVAATLPTSTSKNFYGCTSDVGRKSIIG